MRPGDEPDVHEVSCCPECGKTLPARDHPGNYKMGDKYHCLCGIWELKFRCGWVFMKAHDKKALDEVTCPTCGAVFSEDYCPKCDYQKAQILEVCPHCKAQGGGFNGGMPRYCNQCGKKKEEVDWVVLDYKRQPNNFLCERCGKVEECKMPIAIDEFVRRGDLFTEKHRGCTPKK